MSRFSLLQDRDGGEKRKKKGAAYAAPFLYPTCRLFLFRSRMEGTAATGGAVAATRSNPTFMVMHDGVHRNKDEQEEIGRAHV